MKPFFYAVADNEGNPIMDEICCCESPEELADYFQDQIDNLTAKVVPVYTGPQIEKARDDLERAQLIVDDIKRRVATCHDGIGRFIHERIADFECLPNAGSPPCVVRFYSNEFIDDTPNAQDHRADAQKESNDH